MRATRTTTTMALEKSSRPSKHVVLRNNNNAYDIPRPARIPERRVGNRAVNPSIVPSPKQPPEIMLLREVMMMDLEKSRALGLGAMPVSSVVFRRDRPNDRAWFVATVSVGADIMVRTRIILIVTPSRLPPGRARKVVEAEEQRLPPVDDRLRHRPVGDSIDDDPRTCPLADSRPVGA